MLVKPVGTSLWLTIFNPEKTGCWECLAQRLRNNRPSERFIQRRRDSLSPLTPPQVDLPTTQQTALAMATNEILKWILQGKNKRLEGVIVTYDTLSLTIQNHVLIKRPQCSYCGYLKPQHAPLAAGAKQPRPLPVIPRQPSEKVYQRWRTSLHSPRGNLKTLSAPCQFPIGSCAFFGKAAL